MRSIVCVPFHAQDRTSRSRKIEPAYGGAQFAPHVPSQHWPVQHSASVAQALPTGVHACAVQTAGVPMQCPEQQSAPEAHDVPSRRHAASVQTEIPAALAVHVAPSQQSAVVAQSDPRGRHGPPELNAQRFPAAVQVPLQHESPHASPVVEHSVNENGVHTTPAHFPEQQSVSALHGPVSGEQTAPPQTPPLHASEQQSSADWHAAPSAAQ
jgi:hypothetical protein